MVLHSSEHDPKTDAGRRASRLLRPISWAFAPCERGIASAFQAEVAAPPALLPPFPPGRHGDRLALGGSDRAANLRRPPRRADEKDGGMPPRHPGPEGRGYQQPRPMNRPDPPAAYANGNGGNGELAIGSQEQYQKSPSWPGTGRSCRLFLPPVVTRYAGSCY